MTTPVEFVSLNHERAAWNDPDIERSSDLLVTLALATFVNRASGAATVSVPALAARARLDVKTVRAALERLRAAGKLTLTGAADRPGLPRKITLTLPLTPTDSGTPGFGTPADSGSAGTGHAPSRIREGTPTEPGSRTKGSSTKREGGSSVTAISEPVESAATAPAVVCLRHPNGSTEPCGQCRAVRLAAEEEARSPRPAVLVDGCAYKGRRGTHFMINGDRFCNVCGLDPRSGERIDLKSGQIVTAELVSA